MRGRGGTARLTREFCLQKRRWTASFRGNRRTVGREQKVMLKELREFWDSLPNKSVLLVLWVAWWVLFEFYGAAHLSWLITPSMFQYIGRMLQSAVEKQNDDQLGVWIPFLVVILVIMRRRELTRTGPVEGRWTGVVLVGIAAVAHVLFYSVQQVVLSFQAFLLGAYGLTGVVFGRAWMRRFFFPFVLLCFMMPVVQFINAPTFWLRHFSAASATWIGQHLLNIRLVREATQVAAVDAGGRRFFTFDVVDACSGIRSLKVIVLLTVIFGFLQFRTAWRRWVLLAFAPVLAVAGNVIRLVATFWVGDLFGQAAAGRFETNFGYITFAVAFGGLVLLGRWMQEPGQSPGPPTTPPTTPPTSPA